MSEKTVMIVNALVNPEEKEALAYYQQHAIPLFVQAGGKPLGKFKVVESLLGNQNLHMVAMMEFDSSEAIKGVFESETYKTLLPHRSKAFTELSIFIAQQ